MALHQTSGRWRIGLALALATAGFWATLPVALKIAVERVDVLTLTWFRFLVAALVVGAWLALRGGLGGLRGLGRGHVLLLALAAAMLIANYLLYLAGLDFTTPANAQLIIQLAPLLMAVGGIVVFGERFRTGQWIGLGILVAGLGLFFSDQLAAAARDPGRYLAGSALIVAAAVVWALYALAQKQLLVRLSSAAVMLVIYVVASLVLLPLARPAALLGLDGVQTIAVLYCAFNTLAAYGAFAEALAHWEASRVGLVLAITPLLTLAVVTLGHLLAPELVAPERIGALGLLGAALVVGGSATSSLLGARRSQPAAALRPEVD